MKSNGAPSAREISRVLRYLSRRSTLRALYGPLNQVGSDDPPDSPAGSDPGSDRWVLRVKSTSVRTKRGKGVYDKYYVYIPAHVAIAMGLTEGSKVEVRRTG
jgi:AbrB family looped-hinge helix DNA binding protein